MRTPALRRRHFVLGGAAVGAALLLYWQADLRPGTVPARLLRRLGTSARLRAPQLTGTVDEELLAQLWRLARRIAARWQFAGFVDLSESAFAQFIGAKTSEAPSYLTEYREAGRILADVETEMKADAAAFDQMFAMPAGFPGLETTRLGRLQKFVIAEFIELQIASGGFRAFGYRNYRGFAGGPLSDPGHPPYRSL